jgi:hypothetical protein
VILDVSVEIVGPHFASMEFGRFGFARGEGARLVLGLVLTGEDVTGLARGVCHFVTDAGEEFHWVGKRLKLFIFWVENLVKFY